MLFHTLRKDCTSIFYPLIGVEVDALRKRKPTTQDRKDRSGQPSPQSKDKKPKPDNLCFDFAKGTCSRGAACRFSHSDKPPAAAGTATDAQTTPETKGFMKDDVWYSDGAKTKTDTVKAAAALAVEAKDVCWGFLTCYRKVPNRRWKAICGDKHPTFMHPTHASTLPLKRKFQDACEQDPSIRQTQDTPFC